jgi:hypothetical protein
MLLAPATVGTKVRTMGTKRASTMVFEPCLREERLGLHHVLRVEELALRPVEHRRAELGLPIM